jgi:sec-independent protein translocase protein TatC
MPSTAPPQRMSTPAPEGEQSFLSHLIELRQRLVRAATAVLVVFLALTPFMGTIFDAVSAPLMLALPAGTKLLAVSVIAPVMVPIKVTLFTAFLIALPYVLWQAWAFVAPGLYQHEKRLASPSIISAFLMFLAGMAYCYFVVFGFFFRFIASFAPASVQVAPDIDSYFSFVLGLFLAFGLAFEVPIVVLLLARFGIVDPPKLRQVRPYVIVGAFILAAIFTPPEVMSQLLLAIPLCLLYELGIGLAVLFGKPREPDPAPAAAAATSAASAPAAAGDQDIPK